MKYYLIYIESILRDVVKVLFWHIQKLWEGIIMFKELIKITTLAVGLLFGSMANAAIVNITATGTVSSTDSAQFTIGEEVTWTIQYDDADTTAHVYLDGDNFIAEGGLGDDTLDFTGTDDGANDFADVLFDFGDIFTKLLDGDTRISNTNGLASFNQSIMHNNVFSYASDGFHFFGATDKFRVRNNESATAKDLQFSSVSYEVSAVPLPAALWLFAPALLGFMGFRRRAVNT